MKKSGDFLSLLNNRDLLKTPSGSPIVNFLVKPMSVEMTTADKLITRARRQRMMDLFRGGSRLGSGRIVPIWIELHQGPGLLSLLHSVRVLHGQVLEHESVQRTQMFKLIMFISELSA
ncbi:hypothetical protein M5D96_011386 [Drosophila gunungcola]|uniref:Uncharacterized protein n=1 Tax=Drosophila gunungcola TaxID=103775 RepID=A0A9P9YFQ0_9MUSC|nr:hypothetical protein M5D96_011386 [Drosophila gunungcola]